MTPLQKEEDEAKKLIKFETDTVKDVCNGYYAGTQWESKEDEERTKNTFKCAYRLALRHLENSKYQPLYEVVKLKGYDTKRKGR
jgi:hypothetical protein